MLIIEKDKLIQFRKDCFKNLCVSWPSGNLFEFLKKEMTGPYQRKYLGYAIWVVTTAPRPTGKDMECRKFFYSYLNRNLRVYENFSGTEKEVNLL